MENRCNDRNNDDTTLLGLVNEGARSFVLMLVLIILIVLSCCFAHLPVHNEIPAQDEIPSYYLEPEEYTIAEIDVDNSFTSYYGYISDEDYQSYLNGTLSGAIFVKHPYEEEKGVVIPVNEIVSIKVGTYLKLEEATDAE